MSPAPHRLRASATAAGHLFEDIATSTGGTPSRQISASSSRTSRPSRTFGHSRDRASTVDQDNTTIVDGSVRTPDIQGVEPTFRGQIEELPPADYTREKLRTRPGDSRGRRAR